MNRRGVEFASALLLLAGTLGGCTLQSDEKTAAYEALLDNFVPNGVVDRRLLLTLTQGATSCVTR